MGELWSGFEWAAQSVPLPPPDAVARAGRGPTSLAILAPNEAATRPINLHLGGGY